MLQTSPVISIDDKAPRGSSDAGDLADFSTNRRVLVLSILAVAVGTISSGLAWLLLRLIDGITNLAFFHRVSLIHEVDRGSSG